MHNNQRNTFLNFESKNFSVCDIIQLHLLSFFFSQHRDSSSACHWGQDVWLLLDQQRVIAAMSVYFCETESLKRLSVTPVCVYSPHFLTYHMHRIQICSLFLSLSGLQFLHSQNNVMNHDSHAGPTYILLHTQLSLHVWGLPQLFSMFELDRWILGGKYLSTSFQIVRIKPDVCLCVTLGYEQRIITGM